MHVSAACIGYCPHSSEMQTQYANKSLCFRSRLKGCNHQGEFVLTSSRAFSTSSVDTAGSCLLRAKLGYYSLAPYTEPLSGSTLPHSA